MKVELSAFEEKEGESLWDFCGGIVSHNFVEKFLIGFHI